MTAAENTQGTESTPNTIEGTIYTETDYQSYAITGDTNIFEEAVDNLILENSTLEPHLKERLLSQPAYTRRSVLLAFIEEDSDRYEFTQLRDKVFKGHTPAMTYVEDAVEMLRGYVEVGKVDVKQFGEVMTPISMVEEMLDVLPKEVWSDPTLKWLDNCAGSGIFPMVVTRELMKGLEGVIPDADRRYKHIVENMLYVGELQPKNMFLYLCLMDPHDQYDLNVFCGDFLSEAFDRHREEVWGIDKFDVVVGNPPYQKMTGGYSAQATAIYGDFTMKSHAISDRVVYITPSRWFVRAQGTKRFKEFMLNNPAWQSIRNYGSRLGRDVFGDSVKIRGGVSHFLLDSTRPTENLLFDGNLVTKSNMVEHDVVLPSNAHFNIINKALASHEPLTGLVRGMAYFSLKIDGKMSLMNGKAYDTEPFDGSHKCYVMKPEGFIRYVGQDQIRPRPEMAEHKVFFGKTVEPLNRRLVAIHGLPGEICSATYLAIRTQTKDRSLGLVKYVDTKFFNFMLFLNVLTQHVTMKSFNYVPLVDLDRSWTDEQLYEHFSLTQEEIDLIENTIP